MTSVAVIAHERKTLGGGLPQLRRILAEKGFADPIWYQVPKSRKAPGFARQAIAQGADLVFVWGGDGTVQRCLEVVASAGVAMAILPAGTANLLATNLGIPEELTVAVDIGLYGARRKLDVGVINGEQFAVMAGAGFDANMMREADGGLKDRFGRLAYVWTGLRATGRSTRQAKINVDGKSWFKGRASCILLGNMGTLTGGLTAFPDASPDDGLLEVGVVTAEGALQWARVLARLATGRADRSPLARMTRGARVSIDLDHSTAYELDGGARSPKRRLRASVLPRAVTVCVPETEPS